jgi:hypothetical protein
LTSTGGVATADIVMVRGRYVEISV